MYVYSPRTRAAWKHPHTGSPRLLSSAAVGSFCTRKVKRRRKRQRAKIPHTCLLHIKIEQLGRVESWHNGFVFWKQALGCVAALLLFSPFSGIGLPDSSTTAYSGVNYQVPGGRPSSYPSGKRRKGRWKEFNLISKKKVREKQAILKVTRVMHVLPASVCILTGCTKDPALNWCGSFRWQAGVEDDKPRIPV